MSETHDSGGEIECPHGCGHSAGDLWDHDWSGGRECVETECDGCGKHYVLIRSVSVSYKARATEAQS